jgi:hypothetical protein
MKQETLFQAVCAFFLFGLASAMLVLLGLFLGPYIAP